MFNHDNKMETFVIFRLQNLFDRFPFLSCKHIVKAFKFSNETVTEQLNLCDKKMQILIQKPNNIIILIRNTKTNIIGIE